MIIACDAVFNRSRAMDEEAPEVLVAVFTNPQELRFATSRALLWDEA